MSEAIQGVAKKYYGITKPLEGCSDILCGKIEDGPAYIDLDHEPEQVPNLVDVEIVICGEVLEHLSNAGRFLDRLRDAYGYVPLIVTVPNAYAAHNQRRVAEGTENCNADHVAWHSPRTIRTLLERAGYQPKEWYWYKGKPGTAEGIIVVAE